jgi:hypothetical protein
LRYVYPRMIGHPKSILQQPAAMPAGGDSSGMLPVRMLRASQTKDRLVLPFEPETCCGSGPGLTTSDLPPELARAGVSSIAWSFHVDRLKREVQPLAVSSACCTFALIPHFWIATLLPVLLWQAAYHRALARWLDALNTEVLAPHGMFAALQTATLTCRCGSLREGRPGNTVASWMAVALTPAEAARLRGEPLLWQPEDALGHCLACPSQAIVPHRCNACTQSPGFCGVPCAV